MELRSLMYTLLVCFLLSCSATRKTTEVLNVNHLKFIGSYDLPHNMQFLRTTVGGLSGIDYDAKADRYFLICDDRSTINPVRFYTARIRIGSKGIDSVEFLSVQRIMSKKGQEYPDHKKEPWNSADPESIRLNPLSARGVLYWSNEGERIIRNDTTILQDPCIYSMDKVGNYSGIINMPPMFQMKEGQKGPRQNGTIEGISFTDNYASLLVSMEEPLFEDGNRAGLNDSTAWVRFIKIDMASRKAIGQYGYQIDPVAYPANPPNAFKINGISDILCINNKELLVLERSFSTGKTACTVKIFLASLDGADDISGLASLKDQPFRPVSKKLILNLDDLGVYVDNLEGMTLGPKLPDGRQTLIIVADNNFSKDEISQFFLFTLE